MNQSFGSRLKEAWNVFRKRDPTKERIDLTGPGFFYRPDRQYRPIYGDRSIINSILNRIAMDASAIDIQHVRLDDNGRFIESIDSGLNNCLTVEANVDQTGRAFRQDLFMTLLQEGYVAIIPVDTDVDPAMTSSFDIRSMRVGKIVEWFPQSVKIEAYNERSGKKEQIILPKRTVGIVENPLYQIMNEPNSTLKRLKKKLATLDSVDDRLNSNKLDLIIQLPYVIKSDARKQQAELRRREIEKQLVDSQYGIAYTDGTEKITQLNRPLENNLLSQVEYLTNTLYSQLGITKAVLEGTADQNAMTNYYSRTIEPIVAAVADELLRKFLSKTARSQKQSIKFFRDPFRLAPVESIAEMADKFTRNEILSSNEVRQIIGMRPSGDPKADELRNKNISEGASGLLPSGGGELPNSTQEGVVNPDEDSRDQIVNDLLDTIEQQITSIIDNYGDDEPEDEEVMAEDEESEEDEELQNG